MPKTLAKNFRIEWLQILDEHGNCDQSLRPSLTDEQIKLLYESLVFARAFDEKAFKLQREGRLGTYASILGQEAAQVASAARHFVCHHQSRTRSAEASAAFPSHSCAKTSAEGNR